VAPSNPRRAYVEGFALRIGQRATLLPSAGTRVYGMLYALTHAELERLLYRAGLEHYRPEAVLALPLGARRRRPCVTTCASPRDRKSAIRTTRSVCGVRSPSSTSRPIHRRRGVKPGAEPRPQRRYAACRRLYSSCRRATFSSSSDATRSLRPRGRAPFAQILQRVVDRLGRGVERMMPLQRDAHPLARQERAVG